MASCLVQSLGFQMSGDSPLAVPDELWVVILLETDLASLVTCKQVCQRFLLIVENDVGVTVQSRRSGIAPCRVESSTKSVGYLAWSTNRPVDLQTSSGVRLWKLYGDNLCVVSNDFVHCTRLASPIRGLEQHQWKIDHSFGAHWDFCADPSQDLLILVQETESRLAFEIYLLSLSNGLRHLAAVEEILYHVPEKSWGDISPEWDLSVEVYQSHVGISIQESNGRLPVEFAAWNWTTGKLVCHIEFEHYKVESFTFLPGDLVMFGMAAVIDEELHDAHLAFLLKEVLSFQASEQDHSGFYVNMQIKDLNPYAACRHWSKPDSALKAIWKGVLNIGIDSSNVEGRQTTVKIPWREDDKPMWNSVIQGRMQLSLYLQAHYGMKVEFGVITLEDPENPHKN
ncbi:hypothetical protein CONPUDRAFT_73332 [Coniophora puteana RWD-64-598 SS2]|uniref:F-box domain-containing protein n=1 Tax=Coniophora puteana (strain RWD-64-598) TaxID=741705 RepID=A0A5M3MLV5_CONPW|nr:uncharacterized protein CONPUDRAFT_73332 [Coniophora puteana RWD-64-598 SS2]EIW80148.1 hypothetical protein CONPUDRAFT_73332 [Coniophora puteana RWD-64-598 SS2]